MAQATRNITSTKRAYRASSSDISVIIPAAGMGHRMKSYGPKALINIYEDMTLIERQIELIWSVYPKAEIFVVVGFEAEKVRNRLSKYPVRFIFNPIHQETNVLYSISLAIQASLSNEILIIYGDLIFNEVCIRNLRGCSRVVVEESGMMKKCEVGVCIQGKKAVNFSFGLDTKWAQISYLTGVELELFKEISFKKETSQWLVYEALNYILENGGKIEAVKQKSMKIFEIDSARDLDKIPKNKLTFG